MSPVDWVHVSNIQVGGCRGFRYAAILSSAYTTTSPVNVERSNVDGLCEMEK